MVFVFLCMTFHLVYYPLGPSALLQMANNLVFYGWVVFHSGEGNGNPLQYSRLENLMDGGA